MPHTIRDAGARALAARRAPAEAGCWERRQGALGIGRLRAAAEIAALEAEGWELEGVTTPHYGALTLIGHFRRPAPSGDAGRDGDDS
jgi:hypothetical protein